ncbi:MAG: tRNA (adenosine(37)-N6)-threonylcarbamoyltransferase complex transferase subunit TsaD [Candidatus Omnitrophica bacterium]|nr:tRNA (adenosine(37)-N6)-threonylcarbamoyltransferase complex transferase subunit TsaD [Candidatus Omnitrophota bacterium]
MYVLGIETSCDETSASVVKDGRTVLSNIVASSLNQHKKYGGIIPEIAFRMQLDTITGVTDSALKEAKLKLNDIKLVSVTSGPGLLGSLLVGISFAKAISFSGKIPLLGVNHLYGHIYAAFLNNNKLELPFVALVVSGGHTSLLYIKDFDKIELLGSTRDDACGEAFDKVAKILKLGYPGGPVIERMAQGGNPGKIKFNCSNTKDPLDFSFSGIKTAVLYCIRDTPRPQLAQIKDISASFQETVINTLVKKSMLACKMKKQKLLVVAGGVAANNRLREKFLQAAGENSIKCLFPEKKLCMDNAAMVAGLGYHLHKLGYDSSLGISADLG